MRKIFGFLMAFSILLAACAPGGMPTLTVIPSLTASPAPTETATLAPSAILLPSKTPAPLTITPLPTIPTFTPTFDVRTIVTITLAPKAECTFNEQIQFVIPTENPMPYSTNHKEAILAFLKAYGNISKIYTAYHANLYTENWIVLKDVTNDGLPELIWEVNDGDGGGGEIYGCNPKNSKYELLYQPQKFNPDDYYEILGIEDLNLDGIPEVVISNTGCINGGCSAIFIVEWDGKKFKDLVHEPLSNGGFLEYIPAYRVTTEELIDLNYDGIKEFVWKGGVQPPWADPTLNIKSYYREEIHIYAWDGEYFSPLPVRYAPSIYRFQAIQDADQATLLSEYDSAISLYQDVIFSDKLDSWSKERELQLNARLEVWYGTSTPTAFPEDPTEYPRLAAYAYYRMIILHTYLGEMDAAKVQYATLQEKFPIGNPGHPYVEMATDFWNAYQSSGKMYDACAAAIAYSDAHPEILTPLGSDYHGAQSHTYIPADVCPFQ